MKHLSSQKEIHLHFVCTGNTYRSRLAEAYLKSKQLPWLHVSSSGIAAEHSLLHDGSISWWAMRLIYNHGLVSFMSVSAQQTIVQLLAQAEIVVFMSQEHYQFAKDHLSYQDVWYQIWNIADLDEALECSDSAVIKSTEYTFKQIQEKVDYIVEDLKRSIAC